MKSERRHELQHNSLADWLAKSAETMKPYQNLLSITALAMVAVVMGYNWWSHEAAAQATQAWNDVNAAFDSGNLSKLAKVTEDYPNTTVGQMAAVMLADFRLGQGCDRLFVNKAGAQDELSRAIKLYEAVRVESRLPSVVARATFGLARAKEAKGELAFAEQLYEEVASKKCAYAAVAQQRAEDLKRPATKSMYDQFARFDPKPVFSKEPGEKPSFDLNSLPSEGPPAVMPDSLLNLDLGGKGKDSEQGKEKKK